MCLTSDIGVVQADLFGKAPWQSSKYDNSGRDASALWEFKDALDNGVEIPPMLILHGEKDKRVPLEQAVGMRRALQAAKLPFEFVTYPREGHMIEERKHIIDMADRVVRFVDTHIGSSSQTLAMR